MKGKRGREWSFGLGNNVSDVHMYSPKRGNTNTRALKKGGQEAAMVTETDLTASSAGLGRQLLARPDLDVLAGA